MSDRNQTQEYLHCDSIYITWQTGKNNVGTETER